MKPIYISIIICCVMASAFGQDAHFSQPLMSPLTLNPARTGHMQEVSRLSVQTRGQWWSVANSEYYKTTAASFDHRFCGAKNFYAFGIQVSGNEIWNNPLSNYQLQISGAYHLNMGNKVLALGAQGGLLHYRLNDSRLYFEDQFDPITSGFSGNISQENFATNNLNTWNGNIGLLFYTNHSRNHNYTLGLSIHHLNQPQIQFLEERPQSVDPLPLKWTIYARLKSRLYSNSPVALSPSFLIQRQGSHWYGLFGLMPSIGFQSERERGGQRVYRHNIALGGYLRLAANYNTISTFDAIVIQSVYGFRKIKVSFSFDVNISPLARASGLSGAMELGLIYQFGEEENCVYCHDF